MTATATAPTPPRPGADKRAAILGAVRRVVARFGLHAAPMSAVAREAGVAAGTLYLYFPGKEAMINALYLELLAEQGRAIIPGADEAPDPSPREGLWRFWHRLARWHLDNPDASSVLHQCQASGILTEETRATQRVMDAAGIASFEDAVAHGVIRRMPLPVCWALLVGPVLELVRMRDGGELEPTEDVLRVTFDGVCRSVLPDGAAGR